MKTCAECGTLRAALEESVKLQSHYASLLNMHDGGQRMLFADAEAWIMRLAERPLPIPIEDMIATIPNSDVRKIRIKNVCLINNIDSVNKLCAFSRTQLMRIPNFGRKSVDLLQILLAIHGFHLAGEPLMSASTAREMLDSLGNHDNGPIRSSPPPDPRQAGPARAAAAQAPQCPTRAVPP